MFLPLIKLFLKIYTPLALPLNIKSTLHAKNPGHASVYRCSNVKFMDEIILIFLLKLGHKSRYIININLLISQEDLCHEIF